MKGVVDTYAKNLLDKVPNAYKGQATSMLTAATNNLVISAGNNRTKLDNQKAEFDNQEIWKMTNTNAEFAINTASELPDVNMAKSAINDKTAESMLFINNQAKTDFDNLVAIGSKETRSDKAHMKILQMELKHYIYLMVII